MQLGKTIMKIRKEYELTQEEFARKFSVTRQTVSNWENEKSYPDLLTLIKISDEFEYSLDIMLKENPDMIEEMNQDIKLGKMLDKIYEKGFWIFLLGVIACSMSLAISIVNYEGIVESIIWLVSLLININVLVACIKVKNTKSK